MSVREELRLKEPVFEDEELAVAMPKQPWVLPLGVLSVAMLGGLVFWQLNSSRAGNSAPVTHDATPNAPELGLPQAPPAVFVSPPDMSPLLGDPLFDQGREFSLTGPPQLEEPEASLQARITSPALVIDLSQVQAVDRANPVGAAPTIADLGSENGDARAASFASEAGQPPARAELLANQAFTIVEGAVIPAILETAINSDLPGYVRAIVSSDVRSFDGANVLIPRGSRLVGQYRSSASLGQSRAFVIWTRVIRPDGVNVRLEAPGTDALGRGGLEGDVDRHFLQRFGGAFLLSLINIGGTLASNDAETQVVIGSATSSASNGAAQALQSDLSITPTLDVAQGASLRVFVNRDLDFSVLDATE